MPDVDLDLERALAPLLERPLADPGPLPELERRAARLRRRRWASRVSVLAGAAAVVIVVVALLPNSADEVVRTTPPADAPAEPAPLPGSQHPTDHLQRVASIVVGGEQWHLLAGYDARGGFCSGLESGALLSSTWSCGDSAPLEPGEVLTAAAAQDMRGRRPGETLPAWEPPFLYGIAAKDVAVVRVEFDGGEGAEVAVTGSEAGLPVNFYMVPRPPWAHVEAVTALDASGREIGRVSPPFWWETLPGSCDQPLPDGTPCLPPPPGPPGSSSVTEERTPPPGWTD